MTRTSWNGRHGRPMITSKTSALWCLRFQEPLHRRVRRRICPGYEALYEDILKEGIDDLYCLSVNDAFVMRPWGLRQGLEEDTTKGPLGFKKVKLIPDGTAAFTRGMGISAVWTTERGFGERSWRYSMVVNNGVIEKMFAEQPLIQNSGPDPFEVSDADTMLAYLKSAEGTKDEL